MLMYIKMYMLVGDIISETLSEAWPATLPSPQTVAEASRHSVAVALEDLSNAHVMLHMRNLKP